MNERSPLMTLLPEPQGIEPDEPEKKNSSSLLTFKQEELVEKVLTEKDTELRA